MVGNGPGACVPGFPFRFVPDMVRGAGRQERTGDKRRQVRHLFVREVSHIRLGHQKFGFDPIDNQVARSSVHWQSSACGHEEVRGGGKDTARHDEPLDCRFAQAHIDNEYFISSQQVLVSRRPVPAPCLRFETSNSELAPVRSAARNHRIQGPANYRDSAQGPFSH